MVIALVAADLSADAGVSVAFGVFTVAAVELLRRMVQSIRTAATD